MIGNTFAAFKGSENKKLMEKPGIKDRYGGIANQFAVTEILAFAISLPVMFYTEGAKWATFVELLKTERSLQMGLAISGMSFYLYNVQARPVTTTYRARPVTATRVPRG